MKKFFPLLALIGIICFGLTELAGSKLLAEDHTGVKKWIHYTNLFYFILTLLLHSFASIGLKSGNQKLFVKTMGTNTILRLLFAIGFMLITLVFSGTNIKPYFVGNILLYFIYMAFEIKFLLSNLRPDSETKPNAQNAHE